MNIESRIVEHDDLGGLHIVTLEPVNASRLEVNVVFNSLMAHISGPDSFGIAHEMAANTMRPTVFVHRPGTGGSTLPESADVRSEYARFGFPAVAGAIDEALTDEKVYHRTTKIHSVGFSLGGYAASLYLDELSNRSASLVAIDAPGYAKQNQLAGAARYFGYSAAEILATKITPLSVEESFQETEGIRKELIDEGVITNGFDPTLSMRKSEAAEVFRPTNNHAMRSLQRRLHSAIQDGDNFEMRMSVSGARKITDRKIFTEINKAMEAIDDINPDSYIRRYGFLLPSEVGFWHNISCRPKVLRKLIKTPLIDLAERL